MYSDPEALGPNLFKADQAA